MRDDATFQPDDDDFDYDAAPADYYDDRIVASDLATMRDARSSPKGCRRRSARLSGRAILGKSRWLASAASAES